MISSTLICYDSGVGGSDDIDHAEAAREKKMSRSRKQFVPGKGGSKLKKLRGKLGV
jgi:hypothetical protein